MNIVVNGAKCVVAEGATVAGLLAELELAPGAVVVQRNADIVMRDAYADTSLAENDAVELVRIVGGG